jgi:REP element-mobilizing transposase RayT
MAQSLAKVVIHVIFSTKNRQAIIPVDLQGRLSAYLAGGLKQLACPAIIVNCQPDHAHVLCQLGKTISIAGLVEEIKKSSSKWIKGEGLGLEDFHWQNGYGAFSVSESNVPQVRTYIAEQAEHHKTRTFEHEFRAFLERHGVAFDERYVWD